MSPERDSKVAYDSAANECRSCLEPLRLSEEEMRQVFGSTLRVRDVKLADPETCRARLEACASCPALQAGTTCLHCGCVVSVKAKLLNAKCPYPYQPRW